MSEKEYLYATSEEGPFRYDSEEEAVAAFFEEWEIEDTDGCELCPIYRGEKITVKASHYLFAEDITTMMQENAYEEMDEYVDGWLDGVTGAQLDDLTDRVNAWATEHDLQPTFYKVENVEELKVTVPIAKTK